MQRYNNTNIIVNIPHRYDLDKDSMTNSEIQAYNSRLNKIAKLYRHVSIVECDSNRKYFTRLGLHLNNTGKEPLSKQIVTQIDKLIKDNNRDESKIILISKDESTNMNRNILHDQNYNLQELDEDHINTEVPSNQNNTRQRVVSDNETVHRTSKRQKKVPITRNNYFLWQQLYWTAKKFNL